jgi:hypothetical protein
MKGTMHVVYKVPWIGDSWCSCSHELNFQILRSCLYVSKCNNVMKHTFPAFLLSISSSFNQESIFRGINVTCDLSGSSFLNLQALACLLH